MNAAHSHCADALSSSMFLLESYMLGSAGVVSSNGISLVMQEATLLMGKTPGAWTFTPARFRLAGKKQRKDIRTLSPLATKHL